MRGRCLRGKGKRKGSVSWEEREPCLACSSSTLIPLCPLSLNAYHAGWSRHLVNFMVTSFFLLRMHAWPTVIMSLSLVFWLPFFFVSSLQELDIMSHLEKKLQYVEEEKHRLECRLKNTELELKETQTSLEQSIVKRRVSKRLAVFFSRYEWNFIISLQNLGNERVTIFWQPWLYLNSPILQLCIKSIKYWQSWRYFQTALDEFSTGWKFQDRTWVRDFPRSFFASSQNIDFPESFILPFFTRKVSIVIFSEGSHALSRSQNDKTAKTANFLFSPPRHSRENS